MAQSFWSVRYETAIAQFRLGINSIEIRIETDSAAQRLKIITVGTAQMLLPEFKELLMGFALFLAVVVTRYNIPQNTDEQTKLEWELTSTTCEIKIGAPGCTVTVKFSGIEKPEAEQIAEISLTPASLGGLITPATFRRANLEITNLIQRKYRIFSQPLPSLAGVNA